MGSAAGADQSVVAAAVAADKSSAEAVDKLSDSAAASHEFSAEDPGRSRRNAAISSVDEMDDFCAEDFDIASAAADNNKLDESLPPAHPLGATSDAKAPPLITMAS